MITADIIKVLDLVDSNDPVLAGECLLDRVQDRADVRKPGTADAICGLPGWEEAVVIVVGHLVPAELSVCMNQYRSVGCNLHQAVLHGVGGIGIDLILASSSEEVSLLDLVGPDTLGDPDHPQELIDVVS